MCFLAVAMASMVPPSHERDRPGRARSLVLMGKIVSCADVDRCVHELSLDTRVALYSLEYYYYVEIFRLCTSSYVKQVYYLFGIPLLAT